MTKVLLFCVLAIATPRLKAASSVFDIVSPDGKIIFTMHQGNGTDEAMYYSVSYLNKQVLVDSKLGISCNGENWEKQLAFTASPVKEVDTTWKPIYGERDQIKDHFNEFVININKTNRKNSALQLNVRAYDSGIAFRYVFPENENGGSYLKITDEATEFNFQENTKAWFTARAQSKHQLLPLKNWPDESDRPLTLELPNGIFACLAEAEMVNYSRTKFKLNTEKANSIKCSMYGPVEDIAPFYTPWRVIMVADKALKLLQNNDLILNLNPSCAIENTAWIKPGKVMRDVTLSTSGAKKLVDFAVARNIKYIHFDAGWYGFENSSASDATTVNLDPRRNPNNDLDLKEANRQCKLVS